jgi:hypothetical protein
MCAVLALQTAAAVLAVLDAILAGSGNTAAAAAAAAGYPASSPAGFCLVRPPGHHVLPSRPMGFGLANFMAVATRHAQQQQAVPVRKVRARGVTDCYNRPGSSSTCIGPATMCGCLALQRIGCLG